MSLKTVELERAKGDTYPIVGTMKVNGRPVNLDGSAVKLYIYSTPQIEITADVDDPSTGRVSFDMTAAASLAIGNYFCEVKLHDTHVRTFVRIELSIV